MFTYLNSFFYMYGQAGVSSNETLCAESAMSDLKSMPKDVHNTNRHKMLL